MNTRAARAWLALLLAATVPLASCAKRETAVEAGIRTQTLHLSNGPEPAGLDPHLITDNAIHIAHALFEGLTEADPRDGHPIPGVAERWECSADGLTWIFHLRADARWSTGEPVTAGDFAYSFERLLSPALGASFAHLLSGVKGAEDFQTGKSTDFSQVGVRAVDDRTLVLTLIRPVPYLPVLTTHYSLAPLHRGTIEKFGRKDQRGTAWTRPGNLVGNGAFVLAEWAPHQAVRVTKSPSYWDRSRVKLNEVVFHHIDSVAASEASFRAGQLHTSGVSGDRLALFKSDPHLAPMLHEFQLLGTVFLRLNCTVPPLNDVRVRRALSLAVDRAQLTRHVIHSETAAFSLTPPNCAGYTADRSVSTEVAEARQLLAAAGFPEGRGFPNLELLSTSGSATFGATSEAVQAMWRANLGIHVALAQQEYKVMWDAARNLHYQIVLNNWIGDYLDPTSFLDFMRSASGNNMTGWVNAEYDRLLDQAAAAVDQPVRFDLLRRAEALMLNEAPILPLFYMPRRELRHSALKGWNDNVLDQHALKFVWLEK